MTDEAYTLVQTNKDRAIVRRSAFHKVNGCRSKDGGDFGVEGRTDKQLAKLNGPVCTMDPRKFYTWEEFKALAPNLQEEYLEKLIYRYNIGLELIAKEQFGLTNSASLMKHMQRHVNPDYKSPNKAGFKGSAAGREKYLNDMAEAWCPMPAEEPVPETVIQKGVETLMPENTTTTTTMRVDLTTRGLDVNLLTKLYELFKDQPDVPVHITIGG